MVDSYPGFFGLNFYMPEGQLLFITKRILFVVVCYMHKRMKGARMFLY